MSQFQWTALYKNYTVLKSSDGLSFDRIPRKNLWHVNLIAPTNKKIFSVILRPGYSVFYRRRAIMTPGNMSEAVNILGYKTKDSNISAVAFIYESDWRIEMSDFLQANERTRDNKECREGIVMLPSDLEEIVWD